MTIPPDFNELLGSGSRGACISPDGLYRYSLWRRWNELPTFEKSLVMFVGLNPSTADATRDDPTIRRCTSFAKNWGFGGFVMANLFAYRATDPASMKAAANPVGEHNDHALQLLSRHVSVTSAVACWGNHGTYLDRGNEVLPMLGRPVFCFALTMANEPIHPLYLPTTAAATLLLKGE